MPLESPGHWGVAFLHPLKESASPYLTCGSWRGRPHRFGETIDALPGSGRTGAVRHWFVTYARAGVALGNTAAPFQSPRILSRRPAIRREAVFFARAPGVLH